MICIMLNTENVRKGIGRQGTQNVRKWRGEGSPPTWSSSLMWVLWDFAFYA